MSSPSSSAFASQSMQRTTDHLLSVLRRANTHYSNLAYAVRSSIRPTHHASKRAKALKLSVRIDLARKLDSKYVSNVPLPILEIPTPPSPSSPFVFLSPVVLSRSVVDREREIMRPAKPDLRYDIPTNMLVQQQLDTMSFSSEYSLVALTSPPSSALLQHQQTEEISRWSIDTPASVNGKNTEEDGYSSNYLEGMDLPVSADNSDGCVPCVDSQMQEDTEFARPPRLDVPIDVGRLSWASDLYDVESSSSSSGSGPFTPGSAEELPKLMISIKRKSIADVDMADVTIEKRPKYDRKSWVNDPTNIRNIQKLPSTRRF